MKHLVRAALVKLGINTPTGGHVVPHDHGDDIPVRLAPDDAATELTRHDQHHGHYEEGK